MDPSQPASGSRLNLFAVSQSVDLMLKYQPSTSHTEAEPVESMRGRNDRLPLVIDPISGLMAQANMGQGHRDGGGRGLLSYIDRGLKDIAGQMDALSVLG